MFWLGKTKQFPFCAASDWRWDDHWPAQCTRQHRRCFWFQGKGWGWDRCVEIWTIYDLKWRFLEFLFLKPFCFRFGVCCPDKKRRISLGWAKHTLLLRKSQLGKRRWVAKLFISCWVQELLSASGQSGSNRRGEVLWIPFKGNHQQSHFDAFICVKLGLIVCLRRRSSEPNQTFFQNIIKYKI